MYGHTLIRDSFDEPDYALIDTLFALAEAYLFAQLVDFKDNNPGRLPSGVDYAHMYKDVRAAVDLCHHDGTLKQMVAEDPKSTHSVISSSSSSPLESGGDGFKFSPFQDVDEKSIRKEKPEELVMALAEAKADAVVSKLQIRDNDVKDGEPALLIAADTAEMRVPKPSLGDQDIEAGPTILITADQVVVYEDYSGSTAQTVSSVLVTNLKTGFRRGECDRVVISFHDIPDDVIDKLIEEGIVLHVAGGLLIEHPLVLPYVKELVGAIDSVMGLPKAVTERLIKEAL
ncbi:7-methyl-GTP pyrophosphatase-like protein [Drosera capensis]